ncbi:chorismate-binding protein [Flavobacterium sp.]|uniref:chorismate-binding protein n=1 Tax=Flavobacterium sp. TaxID=239 RepID=UPI002FDB06B3
MTLFDQLRTCLVQKKPFVAYVLPNSDVLTLGEQKSSKLHHFKGQDGFVFTSFLGTESVVIPFEDAVFNELRYSKKHLQPIVNPKQKSDSEAGVFQRLVERAVHEIHSGNLEKVVVSRVIKSVFNEDCITAFENLIQRYHTAFRYLFYHPEVGGWMGATPEQLVQIKGKTFETVALAGTYKGSLFKEWTSKEMHEQKMVTDYIVQTVAEFSSELDVSLPYTSEAGDLVHLKTNISGTLTSEKSGFDLVQSLHPTPAVCGLPKDRAVEFIMKNESYDRSFYTGFLGIKNEKRDEMNFFVNLRCLSFEGQNVNIYVGCGITGESNPEAEFYETEHKSQTMIQIL